MDSGQWLWSTSGSQGGWIHTSHLVLYCNTLLTALRKSNKQQDQCYARDFDPSLRHIYDPDHRILVIKGQNMKNEQPPQADPDYYYSQATSDIGLEEQQNRNIVSSQLSSARNTVKTWVNNLRDGVTNGYDHTLNAIGQVGHGSSSSKPYLPQGQPVAPMPHGQLINP